MQNKYGKGKKSKIEDRSRDGEEREKFRKGEWMLVRRFRNLNYHERLGGPIPHTLTEQRPSGGVFRLGSDESTESILPLGAA